jgi:mono/diheme cytochrome c family protein
MRLRSAPLLVASLASGEAIYRAACLGFHGVEGTGGHGGGPTLIGKLCASQTRLITTTGRSNMPRSRTSTT